MLVEGKGIKITGITKLRTTMEVKVDKDGNASVEYTLSLPVDLSAEEAKFIDKFANLQGKWALELYPSAYNQPLPKG